jgi:hypothetical protein
MEFKTSWEKFRVCGRCLSTKIKGRSYPYCGKCGKMGAQIVLKRYTFSFFKIQKEYKQYDNMVNPFELKEDKQ